tara:strand:- start:916 stop:2544 length:1629 start_codon:yes stop_codon:yes gene_type:complete
MEDNFAQGASYQDLQGFRDYKVGKLDFTGPCPEIDSCSTLLIKADVEIDGDLVVDGTITFNGSINFNIDICNIGKYIHTSTIDANTFNIFNPTGSTCGTLLGETAIIKTIMDGTIPQLQITCDNGVGPDPPTIELRPNNGSSSVSIFYDVNKDIITSAGTATQVANISTASTGDNIILAKDIITTSDTVAMSLRTTGLAPQFSFKADANNAFVIQPTNSATGEISFFPQGGPPNPIIASLGQVSHNFTNVYTNNIISNATSGLTVNVPNGSIGLVTGQNGVGGDVVIVAGVGHDFFVEANTITLNARTNEDINITATTGTSDINITANANTNITSTTTAMTSTNTTTITSTAGNIDLVAPAGGGGFGQITADALQHIITAGFGANKGKITIQGGPTGANMLFTNLSGTAVGSIDGPALTNIPSINGGPVPCDRRVKDNIQKIDEKKKMERYNKLNKIDVVSYDYKNINGVLNINRHIDTGFTTQQLTSVGLDDCVVKQDEDAPQVPNTNALIGLLINAVQVLQAKVSELEKDKPFTLKSHII